MHQEIDRYAVRTEAVKWTENPPKAVPNSLSDVTFTIETNLTN